jgi:non-heme chloroperoxidase
MADDVKWISVNDSKLAFVELGQGDPVVLVHGGLQDYRMWLAHLPRFAERHRIFAYSRRNHYPDAVSADGVSDTAADIHADDLAALIRALGLPSAHVAAHSAGAYAALFFASHHPELVRTLAINEPPAGELLMSAPGGADVLKEFGGRMAPARAAFAAGDIQGGARIFADAVGGPGTYERRSEAERRMNLDNALASAAAAPTTQPRAVFTREMAAGITAPTLLTNGERSPAFFHRIIDELARCLPNAERVVIPASSHTVPSENPDGYDEAVLSFIARH